MASNDVIVRLVADMSNLQAGMQKAQKEISSLKGTTEKASSSINGAFKKVGTVVATAFAVDKIIGFGKEMVEVTASIQALDSQFQQTFKGDQDKAMAGITAQAQEQGIHVDRLKGQWASFYGTFRGNGASANQSLELTKKYMKLAGDGAAYYDKSLEDVTGRLKSLIMGNFEAGDSIGLNLNVTKLDTIAKQKYGKAWQKLNDTQKEFLLLDTASKIYKASGAMGQGARESQNWENVTGNLKATWDRLLSVVGSPVLAGATQVVVALTDKIEFVTGKVQEFADTYNNISSGGGDFFSNLSATFDSLNLPILADLTEMIGNVVNGAMEFVNWFSQMGTGATILAGVLGTLGTLILAFNIYLKSGAIASGLMSTALSIQTGITTALNVVTGLFGALMSFILSPIGLVIAIIGALITVGVLLYKNWDTVCQWATKLGEWLSSVWNGICESVTGAWNSICEATSSIWNSICETISGVWNSICETASAVWTAIATTIGDAWNGAVEWVSNGINSLVNWFTECWASISEACSSAWEFIKKIVQLGIMTVVSIVEAYFKLVTLPIRFVWENTKEYIFQAWEFIKSIVQAGIDAVVGIVNTYFPPIAQFFSDLWNGICETVTTVWNAITSFLSMTFDIIRSIASTVFTAIATFFTNVWEGIKSVATTVWNGITSFLTTAFNFISSVAMTVFNAVATFFTNIWNGIKSVAMVVWGAIKDFFIKWFNVYKNLVINTFNFIKSIITTVFNAIKSVVTNVWNGIKNVSSNVWNGIKSTISSIVNGIKSGVSSAFNSLKSTVSNIWEGIKNAMWKPIEYAKNKIHGLVEAVKSFFNFHIEFPKPKLPHFSLEGEFSLSKMTVPHLNIDWYATGGIATAPSIVGIGEAGDEAILPLSNKGRMKPFAKAVAEMMPDSKKADYEAGGVTVQVGSLVVREEADINRIAEQLFRLQERNRRAKGRTY